MRFTQKYCLFVSSIRLFLRGGSSLCIPRCSRFNSFIILFLKFLLQGQLLTAQFVAVSLRCSWVCAVQIVCVLIVHLFGRLYQIIICSIITAPLAIMLLLFFYRETINCWVCSHHSLGFKTDCPSSSDIGSRMIIRRMIFGRH